MKKRVFNIVCFGAVLVALLVLFEPTRAYFFDRVKMQKELQAKNAERDSLANVLENIRNNPQDLERNARNSGFARKGETMIKIVPVNIEEETRKLKISAFLLLALTIIIALIFIFAIPKKPKKKADGELCQSTDTPQ